MRCQHCKKHDATMEVNLNLQGQVQQLHLCQTCYAEWRSGFQIPSGALPFGGQSPLEEWLRGLASMHTGQNMANSAAPTQGTEAKNRGNRHDILDNMARNLTDDARNGKIDPVIGRDKEVARVMEILNRRNKNNPVLIGEPGVGKTAIAEGLALNIVQGKAPAKLLGKSVYVLDVASLVADTGIRGQFEERMQNLIQELKEANDVILFIDEIHLLVGAGSAQGSMDAGNILKPALARGEIQVIGATTQKEYRIIEKDQALERRFQPVMVHEPTVEEATQILLGLQSRYEDYHHVQYQDGVMEAAVRLAHRYIQDRFLPDKAIDLVDEAGAKANLHADPGDRAALQARLKLVQQEKARATETEAYERAAELRKEELELAAQLQQATGGARAEVTVEDMEQIIEEKTGIPVRKLESSEQSRLRDLEARLAEQVVGQAEAVSKVAKAVRRNRAGLRKGTRPVGTFLFVGPTGVGKTELAKSLAGELFGTKDAMIRLDMSEYMEKHTVSKIIGSPPGYIGYDDAGQLTERVRRNPYSLILLDEVEKAHPDVLNLFLQIMEDGRLTDSQGRTVRFTDTIIIMTSNVGVLEKQTRVGFGVDETDSGRKSNMAMLTGYFRPELLNRFDAVITFQPLAKSEQVRIIDNLLADLKTSLAERGIPFYITDEAKQKIAEIGYDPQFGARPLRRVIQDRVEDRVVDLLMDDEGVDQIRVEVTDGELVVCR